MQLLKRGLKPLGIGVVACLAALIMLFSMLVLTNPGSALAKTDTSPAATEFVVNINDNGEIIPVHTYTIDEMIALTSDEVVYYSSIDAMPAPNITIAKGVTFSALVDDINAKYDANVTIGADTLKGFRLYATDSWQKNYTYDYIFGATRYHYPRLVETWDNENCVVGEGCTGNPVEVEPIFATYSYQERWLTNLDPNQMVGPADEGSTTFRFCFGQTENEITNNVITNFNFGRWVNRLDIILPDGPTAPLLTPDSNTNLGEAAVITFADDQTWREAIYDLMVGNVSIFDDTTLYSIEPGKITLDGSLFPQDGIYKITVKAHHYQYGIVNQPKDGLVSPVLSPDTTNCILGQTEPVTITFEDDPAWREAINDLTVRGLSKDGLYEITPGAIKIQASAFPGVGKSTIVVKANKYKNAIVDQYMKLLPPVLTAAPITIGEDASITFPDDYSWRYYIDTIAVNGTALTKTTDYTVSTGKITIKAQVFQEPGEYTIVITNRGNYVDATVTQTVNAVALATPPVLTADSTDNKVGNPIDIAFIDDETWRNAIREVKVGDTVLESSQYIKAAGKITLDASAFVSAGTYTITIKATGYEDAAAEQEIIPTETTYSVTIDSAITGGTITADKTSAQAGDTVILAVTPDSGKRLVAGSLKYTTDNGAAYTAITATEGVYSFILPEADVTVTAEFEDIGSGSDVWDGSVDVSWYNTTDTEFYISTPAQFAGLAALVNGHVDASVTPDMITGPFTESADYWTGIDDFNSKTIYLAADLDMGGVYDSSTSTWSGPNYTPVGGQWPIDVTNPSTVLSTSFNGTLDGQGHTVQNIYFSRWQPNYRDCQSAGLVGRLGCHDNDDVSLWADNPTVRNVAVTGYIYGNRSIGGIVGKIGKTNNGGIIENCANFASVNNTDSKGCGGIVGAGWNGGYIKNCYNAGDISSTYNCPTGGISGSNEINIYNCFNVGTIAAQSDSFAMAIGTNNGGDQTVSNCYWLTGSAPGGGYYNGGSNVSVTEVSAEYMKSAEFLAALNGTGHAFVTDTTPSINSGYPVLAWQNPAAVPETYTVDFSVIGENGTIAATVDDVAINSGDAVVAGKNVVFTAVPAQGYQVKGWTLKGEAAADNQTNTLTVENLAADTTVTVEFEAQPPTLYTVTLTGDNISSNPAAGEIEENTSVTITVAPAAGKQVAIFTVGGVDKKAELDSEPVNQYIFIITGDTIVEVTYEDIPATTYTLTLTGDNISSNPAAGEIEENTSVTITVAPAEGKQVATFTVDGVDRKAELDSEPVNQYTFIITGDTVVGVTYEDIPAPVYTITVAAVPDPIWTVTPDKATAAEGETVTVTAADTADTSWATGLVVTGDSGTVYDFTTITAATGNAKNVNGAGVYSFVMPAEPVTVALTADYTPLDVYVQIGSGAETLVHSYTRAEMEALGAANTDPVYYALWDRLPAVFMGKAVRYVSIQQIVDSASGYNSAVRYDDSNCTMKGLSLDNWTLNLNWDYLMNTERKYYAALGDQYLAEENRTGIDREVPAVLAITGWAGRMTNVDNQPYDTLNTYRFFYGQSEIEYGNGIPPTRNEMDVRCTANNTAKFIYKLVFVVPETYPVNFSVTGENGTIAATVDSEAINSGDAIASGKNVVFTAAPAEGCQVKVWTLDGQAVADNTSNTLTVENLAAATTVTVEFEAIPATTYTLTLTGENISSNPAAGEIEENTSVTISVAPAEGKQVATFTVGGVDRKAELAAEPVNQYTFIITGDTIVEVTYEAIPATTYTLTLTGDNISSNPAAGEIEENTSVTISVAPAEGKQVATFTVDGVDRKAELAADPANQYTFIITANTTVAVTYEDKGVVPPTLNADTTDNIVGERIDITFKDNKSWRKAITQVKADDTVLDVSQYSVAKGKIALDDSVFTAAGTYSIVVQATGYRDASVIQTIIDTESSTGLTIKVDGNPINVTAEQIDALNSENQLRYYSCLKAGKGKSNSKASKVNYYTGLGAPLADILSQHASLNSGDIKKITIKTSDGSCVRFNDPQNELFNTRYYYPAVGDRVQVDTIIATGAAESVTSDPDRLDTSNTMLLMIGQTSPKERNNSWMVKWVCEIDITTSIATKV